MFSPSQVGAYVLILCCHVDHVALLFTNALNRGFSMRAIYLGVFFILFSPFHLISQAPSFILSHSFVFIHTFHEPLGEAITASVLSSTE